VPGGATGIFPLRRFFARFCALYCFWRRFNFFAFFASAANMCCEPAATPLPCLSGALWQLSPLLSLETITLFFGTFNAPGPLGKKQSTLKIVTFKMLI